MILLENGFKGYLRTYKPLETVEYICYPKARVDNRKYAYIYTKKGKVLATVDDETLKAYKVEGCLRKTWKPIKKYIFGKWANCLNW